MTFPRPKCPHPRRDTAVKLKHLKEKYLLHFYSLNLVYKRKVQLGCNFGVSLEGGHFL